MKQKRYKSVEILEAKGLNRIVCANLLVKLERSIDYCRLRISTWPGKPVFIFICVRVKKHNLKPPFPTHPPPPKKIQKNRQKGLNGFRRIHQVAE